MQTIRQEAEDYKTNMSYDKQSKEIRQTKERGH